MTPNIQYKTGPATTQKLCHMTIGQNQRQAKLTGPLLSHGCETVTVWSGLGTKTFW